VSSQKPDLKELAERLAHKASTDEFALEKLIDDADAPDDVIGFHAQQAAEKLLKAALANAGVTPPRIHDITRLIKLLKDAGLSPPPAVTEARNLTPWAVEFRYEDLPEEKLDRVATRENVAQVRKWVNGLLKAP
jgi:HEPN domain-containing protein